MNESCVRFDITLFVEAKEVMVQSKEKYELK